MYSLSEILFSVMNAGFQLYRTGMCCQLLLVKGCARSSRHHMLLAVKVHGISFFTPTESVRTSHLNINPPDRQERLQFTWLSTFVLCGCEVAVVATVLTLVLQAVCVSSVI